MAPIATSIEAKNQRPAIPSSIVSAIGGYSGIETKRVVLGRRFYCQSIPGRKARLYSPALFNHVNGQRHQPVRNVEAQHLGALQIDDKVEFARLPDRKISGSS
jgi:hypothetical protein